ncbi:polyketide beta-ketoacyl-synthase [Paramarasmius palmivorus]|uniref:Polyketide beta-ketoacyl-synthase n=1 Tax=Paramarasmius palmivorus TaxID=297713 RepID=A0AAW0C8I8_9AGAR
MASTTAFVSVPVFAGHGTTAMAASSTREQAVVDASHPSGALLLSSFHRTFLRERALLSSAEQEQLALPEFSTPQEFLSIISEQPLGNSLQSNLSLFLVQALRYLAHVEAGATTDTLSPFTEFLANNLDHNVGVAGFSSGILPACVVACSQDSLSFIKHAVEVFRFAFWLGLRCQQYQLNATSEFTDSQKGTRQFWSRVVMGQTESDIRAAIDVFTTQNPSLPQIYITATSDDTTFTVSGRPDVLSAFIETLPSTSRIFNLTVDTLYHSPCHQGGLREQVLADVARRGIEFPTLDHLIYPLRSTFSGELVNDSENGTSLVETILDMIVVQPVNWHLVTDALSKASPTDVPVRLLNFGPGTGLTRSMAKAFRKDTTSTVDLTSESAAKRPEGAATDGQAPIAIVGMALNMPGAPNVAKLWEVLEQGINTISEVPSERFNISDYNNPNDPSSKRAMKAHTGNFIADASLFDAKFFRISPREAKSMDPQQRILLQTAYEALENAGYVPNATPTFQKDTFGCYVGVATDDYVQNLRDEIDVYYSTGTLRAFLSGRISYAMGFSGPSVVIDTACSSSCVSVYQACRALSNGDCNAAVAGGVNVIASPDMMLGLDRAHFLSPTGQCKPFDSSADGYSRSEGCGLFVLKRLSDAVAENDNILGVIRGVEVNQSGNAHSITHPHAPTQVKLFERLLEKTGIDRHRINVIEAHGTGTQAGDPNELESIRKTFATGRPKSNPLHITSVKANIGHLEAASGSAGLAKLLLMLRYRTIPRLISLKNLNPLIAPLASDNTAIDTVQCEWSPSEPGLPRLAMLNNFGAAGSNGAVLLEEYIPPPSDDTTVASIALPFGLSAKDAGALDQLRQRYIEYLRKPESGETSLPNIAYTMTARRQIYPFRMAVTASTRQELIEKLQQAAPVQAKDSDAEVAFVFSGQGGQYLGMGAALYETCPVFKKHIDECRSMLLCLGFGDILSIILSPGEGSGLSAEDELEVYQTAVFSLEYSLAQMWMSWGLSPVAVVGHSLGEYAALVVAGVLSLRSALYVIASRVRLMLRKCEMNTTGMIAINNGPAEVQKILDSSPAFEALSIACYNSVSDCVAAGPIPQLKALKSHLDEEIRCKSTILNVPFGYHSAAMKPLVDDLNTVLQTVKLNPPSIPVVSNVFGNVVEPGDASVFTSTYFSRHCAEPVKFSDGFAMLLAHAELAASVWIEVGPHPTTLPMIKACPTLPKDTRLLPSLRKNQDPWVTLTTSLSTLYAEKSDVTWRNVFSHFNNVGCVDLPSYPFTNVKYWVDFKESKGSVQTIKSAPTQQPVDAIEGLSLLRSWVQRPSAANGNVAIVEVPISALAKLISGHQVGEHPLCPASVYHELAMAAVKLSTPAKAEHYIALRDIDYAKPLVYAEQDTRSIRTVVSLPDGTWKVTSLGNEESVHCTGKFSWDSVSKASLKFQQYKPILTREIASVLDNADAELFSTRTAYEIIFPRVVDYSKEYHSARCITVHPSGMEGHATVKIPHALTPGQYVVHPVFMDTLLHVAGFIANMQASANDAFICSQVDSVKVVPELIDDDATYDVFCRNAWLPEEGLILADAYAVTTGASPKIVAHLKRMHFRKVRLASLKRALKHAQGGTMTPTRTNTKSSHATAAKAPVSPSPVKKEPTRSSSDVLDQVRKAVADTCDLPVASMDVSADLTSLGVDSLMSIEIFGRLQAMFPNADLDPRVLSHLHTISEIAREVASKAGDATPADVTEPSASAPAISAPPFSSGNVLEQVRQAVADTCDLPATSMDVSADLTSLGVDSLMSIEIFGRLQALFPNADLDPRVLSHLHTISEIAAEVVSKAGEITPAATPESSGTVVEDVATDAAALEDQGADVKTVVADVLGVSAEELSDDTDLESLGLDSLTSIEVMQAVHDTLSVALPQHLLASHPTIRAINDYVSTQRKPVKGQVQTVNAAKVPMLAAAALKALALDEMPAPLLRDPSSRNSPLFLIHDGSGLVNYYGRMSSLQRNTWGIFNPNFATSEPWINLESMAAKYASVISQTARGPVLIGGWSFGGVVAFEAARQLMSAGHSVKGVVLIDSPSPVNHVPLSDTLIDAVVNLDSRAAKSDISRLVKQQFQMNSAMLGKYEPSQGGSYPPLVLLRSSEGFKHQSVAVPTWLSDRTDARQAVAGWEKIVGSKVKVLDILGNHFEPFSPTHIVSVSQQVSEACSHLESL